LRIKHPWVIALVLFAIAEMTWIGYLIALHP